MTNGNREIQKFSLNRIVRDFFEADEVKSQMTLFELLQAEEAVKNTGERILHSWEEFLTGYKVGNINMALSKRVSDTSTVIAEKGIDFSSMCMHHFFPFYGTIDIIYSPNKYICGLSKLSRVVEKFSRRFQLQETLGDAIASSVFTSLEAEWVIVVVNSTHTCVGCRGVRKLGASLTTVHALGIDYTKALEVCRSV